MFPCSRIGVPSRSQCNPTAAPFLVYFRQLDSVPRKRLALFHPATVGCFINKSHEMPRQPLETILSLPSIRRKTPFLNNNTVNTLSRALSDGSQDSGPQINRGRCTRPFRDLSFPIQLIRVLTAKLASGSRAKDAVASASVRPQTDDVEDAYDYIS